MIKPICFHSNCWKKGIIGVETRSHQNFCLCADHAHELIQFLINEAVDINLEWLLVKGRSIKVKTEDEIMFKKEVSEPSGSDLEQKIKDVK